MIKTIFFDFDGVITIDAKGSLSFANYIVEKTGIDKTLFLENYRQFGEQLLSGQKNHLEIWDELAAALGVSLPSSLIEEAFIATPINFDIIALIKQLKKQGYSIGLITDNKNDRMKSLFDYHHWKDLFDVVAISASVGSRKNTPKIYHFALESGKALPTESLFIDNTLKNLKIPSALGFKTLFFDNDLQDLEQLLTDLEAFGINIKL